MEIEFRSARGNAQTQIQQINALALAGLGKTLVALAGGLDLSVLRTTTLTAIVATTLANGLDAPTIWVISLSLAAEIAVVVLGGTLIAGGHGHYLGILGGAILFTALGIMLSGTVLPEAVRNIIYGLVVLGAIIALRECSEA